MNKTLLENWMKLKKAEDEFKQQRIELESTIAELYPVPDGKESVTVHDGDFEIVIKLNKSYKPAPNVELPPSCYKTTLNPTTVKKYAVDNPSSFVVTNNKPTIKVVKNV